MVREIPIPQTHAALRHLIEMGSSVLSAGLAWGMGGLMDSPLAGFDCKDYAIGLGSLCFQRSVSAVDARFCMVQVSFLREVMERSGCDLGDPLLPAWFAAVAQEQGKRVLFTPYAIGQLSEASSPRLVDDAARYRYLAEFGKRLTSDRYYSRFYGLTAATAYQPVRPEFRRAVLERSLSPLADTVTALSEWLGPKARYPSFLYGVRDENVRERIEQGRAREVA